MAINKEQLILESPLKLARPFLYETLVMVQRFVSSR